MSIAPARLEGITSDKIETGQFKTLPGIGNVRPVDMAKHIRFAAARCARARPSKELEKKIRLSTVVPANGQLVADLLNVQWLDSRFPAAAIEIFFRHRFTPAFVSELRLGKQMKHRLEEEKRFLLQV